MAQVAGNNASVEDGVTGIPLSPLGEDERPAVITALAEKGDEIFPSRISQPQGSLDYYRARRAPDGHPPVWETLSRTDAPPSSLPRHPGAPPRTSRTAHSGRR